MLIYMTSIRYRAPEVDISAGSEAERKEVEDIKAYLESLGMEVKVHAVDVALWEHGYCEVDGVRCVPIPQTPGGHVEGVLTDDIYSCGDRVLISSTTSYPDNMWNIYNEAVERGARAVVFYDYYPGRLRKIVVTGVWSYGHSQKIDPRIPAVHVRLEDGVKMLRRSLGKKIYLRSETRIRSSRGATVEAIAGGRRTGSILVSAHHDRWFNSYRDNAAAVKTILEVARQLSKGRNPLHDIRVVSFTAEEIGDPAMPAWYWGYGSRVYASTVDPEEILLAIVIDTAFREPIRVSTTSPDHAHALFKDFPLSVEFEGYGHPYTDAPSLWTAGIPTITLHNLEEIYPVYHTDLDVGDQPQGFPSILARSLYLRLKDLEPDSVTSSALVEDLKSRIPDELFEKIAGCFSREKEYRLVRCVNKHTMRPIFYGSYRELYKDMEVDPLPYSIAYRASREGRVEEIKIPGEELVIYSGRGASEEGRVYRMLSTACEELYRCLYT